MTVIAISNQFNNAKECYQWAEKQRKSFPNLFFLKSDDRKIGGYHSFFTVVRLPEPKDVDMLGKEYASYILRVTDDMRILYSDEMKELAK